MKSNIFWKFSILVICYLFFSDIDSHQLNAQNFILNPGCEDSLVNGEIPYWTEVQGDNWTQRFVNPEPFQGNAYFFPGVAAYAELIQDVDLSEYSISIDDSLQFLVFKGYVRSYSQTPIDYSRIVLEYLDSTKYIKIDSADFGDYSNTSSWVEITDTIFLPSGTRFVRIRLISLRNAGSNNDGYYDALSLSDIQTSTDLTSIIPPSVNTLVNFPNPFSSSTTIEYELKNPSNVQITICNHISEVVYTISENQTQGKQEVLWKSDDLPSGIYFCTIKTNEEMRTTKMIKIE